MKKGHAVAGIVSALVLGAGALIPLAKGNPAHAEAIEEDCYLVNSNQISVAKSQYDLFQQMDIINTTPSQNPGKSYYDSDGTKALSTNITLEKLNIGYKMSVKQTVEWQVAPPDRYNDILGLNYTEGLIVNSVDGCHDITATLNYTENEYDGKKLVGSHNKSIVYTGEDIYSYSHGIRANISQIAFLFPLPRAEFSDSGHKIKTDNISISLETTFLTKSSDLTGAGLQSIFMHQNGSGKIIWDRLYFNAKPTVSYRNKVWVNDPEFDTTLSSYISINFDDLISQSRSNH